MLQPTIYLEYHHPSAGWLHCLHVTLLQEEGYSTQSRFLLMHPFLQHEQANKYFSCWSYQATHLKLKKKIKGLFCTASKWKQWIPASLDLSTEHLSKQMWTANPSRQTAMSYWTGCNISHHLKNSFTTFNMCCYHTLIQAHIAPHGQKLETCTHCTTRG